MLKDINPIEHLTSKKPSVLHLRVFGCSCYVYISEQHRDKLDYKSVKYIFLGYSKIQKGYKCYDPKRKETYVSRDVQFFESIPYYANKDDCTLDPIIHREESFKHIEECPLYSNPQLSINCQT